jgi:crossover junction endodeoxyribonuclease RuvC
LATVVRENRTHMSRSIRNLWTKKIRDGTCPRGKECVAEMKERFEGYVLGVDPSLRGTGLAVVHARADGNLELKHSRTLKLSSQRSFPDCLGDVFRGVTEVTRQFSLDAAALEETIFVQSVSTAQKMGASRGAVVAALNVRGVSVDEYLPLRVKKSVVGFGHANKIQVAKMVQILLNLPALLPSDESDAAAVALCHIFNRGPLSSS